MKNCNENIIRLIQLYWSGELTPEESEELERWCGEALGNRDFLHSLSSEELLAREFPLYNRINEDEAIRRFEKVVGRKRHLLHQMMKYAAILLLPILAVTVWLWNEQQPTEIVSQTIVPGSAKAILTLAGGQQVSLAGQKQQNIQFPEGIKVKQDVGLLVYDSLAGHKLPQIPYNTLSTGRGGEYRLILADGTKVFLNAATTLTYPVVFNEEVRKVQLDGEAYFEVAKDATHAFIVETQGMEVRVYGTSFNINTLCTNEVQTVLVEGSIGIRALASDREYQVQPGQMAVWNQKDDSVELQEVNVTLYTAWKDGVFRFNQERLEDILMTLSNWYDVDIFYQNQDIKDLHFSGYMERYEQITTILEAITESTGVRFSVQDNTIIVSK